MRDVMKGQQLLSERLRAASWVMVLWALVAPPVKSGGHLMAADKLRGFWGWGSICAMSGPRRLSTASGTAARTAAATSSKLGTSLQNPRHH
jgi:hypothetical protein